VSHCENNLVSYNGLLRLVSPFFRRTAEAAVPTQVSVSRLAGYLGFQWLLAS